MIGSQGPAHLLLIGDLVYYVTFINSVLIDGAKSTDRGSTGDLGGVKANAYKILHHPSATSHSGASKICSHWNNH